VCSLETAGNEKTNGHAVGISAANASRTALFLIAVALPAILAFGVLYRNRLAVPYQDDYNVILSFASDYQQLSTVKSKLLEIATKQTNDYKLGFEHLIIALEMEFTGHLNFGFLVTVGDLFLLPIVYLLWLTYQTDDRSLAQRLMEFVLISALFFSLTYWETLNWAMAGLTNLPVILFALLAIWLLIPKGPSVPSRALLFLSCLSAMLSAFSSANGFLLAPVGALILLRRRTFMDCLIWCASFALPLACYLYHYTPYVYSVHMVHRFDVSKLLIYFLAVLGCVIPVQWAAALLGLLILAIIAVAVRSRFDRTNPPAFYFTVWILGTALVIALLRGPSASRYSIYSIFLLIFCYAFLREYLPNHSRFWNPKRLYSASVVLAMVFCVCGNVRAYRYLGARRRMVLSGIEHYRSNPGLNSPMVDPQVRKMFPEEEAFEQAKLTEAIQQHIYTLPSPLGSATRQ